MKVMLKEQTLFFSFLLHLIVIISNEKRVFVKKKVRHYKEREPGNLGEHL